MNNFINYIFSPKAIRDKAQRIYDLSLEGKTNFQINEDKLEEVSKYVLEVIHSNYPTLTIPFHSRWGHFNVGGVDRVKKLLEEKSFDDKIEQCRSMLDLAITSVLLDAGAGPTWNYLEKDTEKTFNRSEGLGVASFHMFADGSFSNNGDLKADGNKLKTVQASDIESSFQVNSSNPLVAAEGRALLLRSLGECTSSKTDIFKDGRPGNLVDHLISKHGMKFKAQDVLKAVLEHFGDIWPSRINLDGTNLGDVWSHSLLKTDEENSALIPFHKLSQWLTYSLIEPMLDAGIEIDGVEDLTGLAEYRNGGLILDLDLISLKDKSLLEKAHKPDSEVIIEWRALTIIMLDKIADNVRGKLKLSPQELPLAKVLEGGTWWAGRKIAAAKRSDSSPPLKLDSDGTVF